MVFGEVEQGAEIVKRMEAVETGPNDKPVLTDKAGLFWVHVWCSWRRWILIFWFASRSRACAWGWTQVVVTDCGVYTGGAPGAKGGKEKDKDKDKKKKSKSACQPCRAVFHVHPSKWHIPTDLMHGYKTTHTHTARARRAAPRRQRQRLEQQQRQLLLLLLVVELGRQRAGAEAAQEEGEEAGKEAAEEGEGEGFFWVIAGAVAWCRPFVDADATRNMHTQEKKRAKKEAKKVRKREEKGRDRG